MSVMGRVRRWVRLALAVVMSGAALGGAATPLHAQHLLLPIATPAPSLLAQKQSANLRARS